MGVHGLSRTTMGVDDIATYMTLTAMECYGIVHRPAMNVSHDIGMGPHCRIRAHPWVDRGMVGNASAMRGS